MTPLRATPPQAAFAHLNQTLSQVFAFSANSQRKMGDSTHPPSSLSLVPEPPAQGTRDVFALAKPLERGAQRREVGGWAPVPLTHCHRHAAPGSYPCADLRVGWAGGRGHHGSAGVPAISTPGSCPFEPCHHPTPHSTPCPSVTHLWLWVRGQSGACGRDSPLGSGGRPCWPRMWPCSWASGTNLLLQIQY